jgi:hypothetical protein
MKAASVFFLSLCFLLLGRSLAHADLSVPAGSGLATIWPIQKSALQSGSLALSGEFQIGITNDDPREQEINFFDLTDDDEEAFTSRVLLLVKCLVAFTCVFLLSGTCKCIKGYLSFSKNFSWLASDKYLRLRVLRI